DPARAVPTRPCRLRDPRVDPWPGLPPPAGGETHSGPCEVDRPATPSVHAGLVCHGLPLLSTGRAPVPAATACCTSVPPTIAVTVGSACAACAAGKLSLRRSAAGRQQSALRAGLSWHGVGHRVRLGEVEQPVDAEEIGRASCRERG